MRLSRDDATLNNQSSYVCALVLASIAFSVNGLILLFEAMMFWSLLPFVTNQNDPILFCLLIKNIACVSTEVACMIVACSAGGAARTGAGSATPQTQMTPVHQTSAHAAGPVAVGVPVSVP